MKEKYPFQEFNGKKYYLYPKARYFTKSNKRMHRVVWEYHNGIIPKGYDIHHVDGNPHNNDIKNLNIVLRSLHQRFTMKQRFKNDPEWAKKFMDKGKECAKKWHSSKEGIEKHRQQAIDSRFGKPDLPIKKCENCKEDFKPKNYTSKFCSNKCKSSFRRKSGVDDIIKKCVVCEKEFKVNKYSKTNKCASKCLKKTFSDN